MENIQREESQNIKSCNTFHEAGGTILHIPNGSACVLIDSM